MSKFHKEILMTLTKAPGNFYPENFDWSIRKLRRYQKITLLLEKLVNRIGRLMGIDASILFVSKNNYYLRSVDQFETTFELLSDEGSKRKYIELLVFRMLGFTKVRLSLNSEEFWASRAKVASFERPEKIPVNFRNGYLSLYDLANMGYNLKLYFVENGIFVDFILQQYNYNDFICVNKGDVVIDAGGCWGDTALYFAARGAAQVFVYEFIPSNIEIFNRNVSLNPQYAEQVSLIEKAVWESSDIGLSFVDRGPASRVAAAGVYSETTQTLSIDDLVNEKCLTRVDFIKMDIEGTELSALKGAADMIRKHKPKLAISVYHKPDDLITIPAYIQSLNPDYEFYLDYYTIIGDEIILYAIDKACTDVHAV